MQRYTDAQVEGTGKRASFRTLGGLRDGWIMPDGWGVDYAGYGQVVFRPDAIDQIIYHEERNR